MTYRLNPIAKGLWQLSFHLLPKSSWFLSTNCWLWQEPNRQELTLIDTGYPENGDAIIEAVKSINVPLKRIILTHAHPDHAGGAELVSKTFSVPVYAHEKDIPFLRTQDKRSMAVEPGSALCKLILAKTPPRYDPPAITDLQAIDLERSLAGLIPLYTPGHTPGSLSLWCEDLKAVFCGDNIDTTIGRPCLGVPIFCLNANERNKSVRETLQRPVNMVLSGHGPAFKARNAFDKRIATLRSLLDSYAP